MASGSVARRCAPALFMAWASIALLGGLTGCGTSGPGGYPAAYDPDYAPPGPAGDPWGPYIAEASARFSVPETWIREVMRRESGGRQYMGGSLTTSSQGAMGLMQVMPGTYAELRARYGLDDDPYHPYNNIMAGTAYIREMYDRFGAPGFLAAYNAGPRRLEDHLYGGRPLPGETVAYLAAVAPRLGVSADGWGPLAGYAYAASDTPADELNRRVLAETPWPVAPPAAPPIQAESYAVAYAGSAADDLNRQVLAQEAPIAAPAPASPYPYPSAGPDEAVVALAADHLNGSVLAASAPQPAVAGGSGVQVGAFSTPAQARVAADNARAQGNGLLSAARVAVTTVSLADGSVLYRARLLGITPELAGAACNELAWRRIACIVLTPDQSI